MSRPLALPFDDPAGRRRARRVIPAVMLVAFVSGVLSFVIFRSASLGLVLAAPTFLAGILMLAGPLRRRQHAIIDVTADDGPRYCSRCGYLIKPPPSAACPECGGREVSDEPAGGFEHRGGIGLRVPRFRRPARDDRGRRPWTARHGRVIGLVAEILVALAALVYALLVTWHSVTHGSHADVVLMGLRLGILGTLIVILPLLVVQLGMRARVSRWLIPSYILVVPATVLLINWPAWTSWPMHRPALERLHARVLAGDPVDLPLRVGAFRIARIETLADGSIGFFGDGQVGLIRTSRLHARPPGLRSGSMTRRDPVWWSHAED